MRIAKMIEKKEQLINAISKLPQQYLQYKGESLTEGITDFRFWGGEGSVLHNNKLARLLEIYYLYFPNTSKSQVSLKYDTVVEFASIFDEAYKRAHPASLILAPDSYVASCAKISERVHSGYPILNNKGINKNAVARVENDKIIHKSKFNTLWSYSPLRMALNYYKQHKEFITIPELETAIQDYCVKASEKAGYLKGKDGFDSGARAISMKVSSLVKVFKDRHSLFELEGEYREKVEPKIDNTPPEMEVNPWEL